MEDIIGILLYNSFIHVELPESNQVQSNPLNCISDNRIIRFIHCEIVNPKPQSIIYQENISDNRIEVYCIICLIE